METSLNSVYELSTQVNPTLYDIKGLWLSYI